MARVDTSGLERQIAQFVDRAHLRATQEFLRDKRNAAPVDTGATKTSGRVTNRMVTRDRARARITFSTPQAKFTDEGTRPHVIRPKNASVLRFRVGNRIVYAKKVNHPGSTKHEGWFSDNQDVDWRRVLERVVRFVSA